MGPSQTEQPTFADQQPTFAMRCRVPTFAQKRADAGHQSLSGLGKSTSYIQDSKLEGVIPAPERKLYLVYNQLLGRIRKEKALDRGKQGTKGGVCGTKQNTFDA